MTGVHKNGLGWNARGVFCGECNCDTCEGCPNEHKAWEGPDEETIERIRKEINDEDEYLRHKKKLATDELAQLYKSIIRTAIRTGEFNPTTTNITITTEPYGKLRFKFE